MATLTGEDVVSAVSKQVRSRFSTAEIKAIYKDLPQQNIKKPYAFIHQVNATHTNQLKNKAKWGFIIDIRVHPEDEQTNVQTWARDISVRMIEAVNIITISGQSVKSTSLEYKVEDNVLHFIVSYSYGVVRMEDDVPNMETIAYGDRIK